MTSINRTMHDVLTGEFSSSKPGPLKFTSDHLKLLRESKVTLDHIANQEFTTGHDVRRLIVPNFQANGLESEVKVMKLCALGLYTIQHISSVDIPNNINCLHDLRKKAIPRLLFMKYHALKKARILSRFLEKEKAPSYDDVETVPNLSIFPKQLPRISLVVPQMLSYKIA
ncbi:hypothetical protein CLU79DRAFT_805521 [Phycomyces nitens]|nr:hypothetical protein CLU79DRAFT_805521 [Phycomyces nitens]